MDFNAGGIPNVRAKVCTRRSAYSAFSSLAQSGCIQPRNNKNGDSFVIGSMFLEELICPLLKQTSQQEHVLVSPAHFRVSLKEGERESLEHTGQERKERGRMCMTLHTVRCEESARRERNVFQRLFRFRRPPVSSHHFFKPFARLSLLPLIGCKGK